MPALARATGAHTIPSRPRLEVVETAPRRRTPRAASVALYSAGMVIGFLLAALASGPGGGAVVGLQLALAGVAAVVAVVAATRARRAAAPPAARGTGRRSMEATALRRAA